MPRLLSNPTQRHDVVVVGARCAGAATAMLLAAAGHDVALVDRSEFPSDTWSTHAIARSGVVQLNRWRLLPAVLEQDATLRESSPRRWQEVTEDQGSSARHARRAAPSRDRHIAVDALCGLAGCCRS